ncbi:protoporphyrinogen/coproporphyrinogen oxidase [Cecembia calidifontis]|uniref:Protoporphyrinogen oxidase n=1 Tax=Cecembia calidifontis TaxID=1187080 RepID=A0A4Q7PBN0_9BACT|nr:NAD(P)-binding protein [Cecembia calidifontis]RZS96970.1 protoporphyrinogen oxidase [Cecembia calidifontis]
MEDIIVLGAGMAGYGAANEFKKADINTFVFEKNNYIGGHCASFTFENKWIFDDGPHISFSKNDQVKQIFADNADNDFHEFSANPVNYWNGKWIKHPAQINLSELPPDLNTQILLEMIEANYNDNPHIENYQDWLYASFGKTFSENFPMKYTRKFHTTEAKNLTTDWLGPRIYKPQLSEVIFGMLSPRTQDVHYIKEFRYPNKGGFVTFMKGIHDVAKINLNHELTKIDLKNKCLTFNNGLQKNYKYCFSSLPLSKIVELIQDAPENIKKAGKKLAFTKCVLVNLGINRRDLSESHWRYVYDENLFSTRISFPHMFGPKTAPEDAGSIQVEIYFSDKYKPLNKNPEDFIEIVKSELIEMGILTTNDKVIFEKAWLSPFAQVIFDHERKENVDLIHAFLKENNIYCGGRFANWDYSWSDESFLSGEKAANEIINKLR